MNNKAEDHIPEIEEPESLNETCQLPGIIRELGELPSGAIVTEEAVARLFRRHPTSVKRAVQRGELPPPCRLFGGKAWTAGTLVRHIEARLELAAKEVERTARKIVQMTP